MIVEPYSIPKSKLISGIIDFANLCNHITGVIFHGDSLVVLETLFTANWTETNSAGILLKRNQKGNNRARVSSVGWR